LITQEILAQKVESGGVTQSKSHRAATYLKRTKLRAQTQNNAMISLISSLISRAMM
jgi:hypothetical protein